MPVSLLKHKVIIYSHAVNWNKLVSWNDMEEHIEFQLEGLPVIHLLHCIVLVVYIDR